MKRILVIGSGGAGKSTFARRLARTINVEVIHLDSLYWKPGWVETPKQEWKQTVERIITRDSWIMDGNYSGTLDLRLEACDTVIFLDIARAVCIWRVIKRAVAYRNKSRPDMSEGCPERFDFGFLRWIWNYKKRTRPKIVRMLKEIADNKKVIWLRTDAEVERYLGGMEDA
ncbi:MAG TPA: DNA topology modulation protein [Candidatus Saccharimonadales bacterium]|jgi:adenylate kinase family enzyme|nr:DNA topology modulation protein [Candidatus Saccharimonadales bacterium]